MFDSEQLDSSHVTDVFDTGTPSLDSWLQQSALLSDSKRQSRTYVWCEDSKTVAGYFSLAPHVIERAELSPKFARGNLNEIPSILLARLALDHRYQGRGLGAELLTDALSRAVTASNIVGGRYVVVDAIDDRAGRFYEHFGFALLDEGTLRRYLRKVSDIEASLG